MRQAILAVAAVFVGALGVLTAIVAIRDGVDVLTGISVLVLAMFWFGIVGALRHPPEE